MIDINISLISYILFITIYVTLFRAGHQQWKVAKRLRRREERGQPPLQPLLLRAPPTMALSLHERWPGNSGCYTCGKNTRQPFNMKVWALCAWSYHSIWYAFIIDLVSETRLPRPHCSEAFILIILYGMHYLVSKTRLPRSHGHLYYVLSSSNEWFSAVGKFVCIVDFIFCISLSLCREHSEATTRVDQKQSPRTDQ